MDDFITKGGSGGERGLVRRDGGRGRWPPVRGRWRRSSLVWDGEGMNGAFTTGG